MSETVGIAHKRFFLFSVVSGWFCIVVVLCIQLTVVVPRFSLLYEDIEKTAPVLTSLVFQLSNIGKGNPVTAMLFLLLMSAFFGVCTYHVQKRESKTLYLLYASIVLGVGSIVNVLLFASLYIPIFSQ